MFLRRYNFLWLWIASQWWKPRGNTRFPFRLWCRHGNAVEIRCLVQITSANIRLPACVFPFDMAANFGLSCVVIARLIEICFHLTNVECLGAHSTWILLLCEWHTAANRDLLWCLAWTISRLSFVITHCGSAHSLYSHNAVSRSLNKLPLYWMVYLHTRIIRRWRTASSGVIQSSWL